MKAEVALLTRNIRITSLEYDDREKDAYMEHDMYLCQHFLVMTSP